MLQRTKYDDSAFGAGYRKWVKTILAIGVAALALMITACSGEKKSDEEGYRPDGYLGYTQTNPNLWSRHSTLSYGKDVDLIGQALAPIKGIADMQIRFAGSELHVTLEAEPSLSDEEKDKLRAEAQQTVEMNMSQYEVHVAVKP